MARLETLIIDGSNVVHALYGSWPGSREEQNEHAADFVARLSAWTSREPGLEIEVVFDGGNRPMGVPPSSRSLRVLFSGPASADAIILERIRALRYFHGKVTVVTRDRALAEDAEKEESKVLGPDRLWSFLRRKAE